jgi:hypothetical protein
MKRGPKVILLFLLTLLSLYGFYRVSLRVAINRHLAALRTQGLPVRGDDLPKLYSDSPDLVAFLRERAQDRWDVRFVSEVAESKDPLGRELAVKTRWTSADHLRKAHEGALNGDAKSSVVELQQWLELRKAYDAFPSFLGICRFWQDSALFSEILEELLDRVVLSEEQLVGLSAAIQEQQGPSIWLRTIAVERVLTHEALGNMRSRLAESIGWSRSWNPVLKFMAIDEYNQLIALEAWRKIEQASTKPFPQAWPLVIAAQQHYLQRPFRVTESKLEYASPVIHWCLQHPTHMNFALTSIAAERYWRAHGKWPAQLTDLVPAYLPAVPLDPFGEAWLKSKVEPGRFIAYSVGLNSRDDHATDDDFTFTITRPRE